MILERDKRYDGLFFFAVTSTGIYCRPSCPAPRPLAKHVTFYQTTQEARADGFRACKRCHPDEALSSRLKVILDTVQSEATATQSLEVLAKKLKLSSRHLRRTIKEEVGLNPFRIKQAERLNQACQLLKQTNLPVTEVAFRADFASLRQFNRAFKIAFNCTPRQYRQTFATSTTVSTLTAITTETPIGPFHLIADDQNVVYASGFGSIKEVVRRLPKALQELPLHTVNHHPYQDAIQNYFQGDKHALDPILRSQTGSEFQKRVWQAISTIAYGQTVNYTQLAAAAGYPGAVRAAGTACGQNRLILLVPCHRIIKSDGSIGNYACGPALKEYLLQHEAAC